MKLLAALLAFLSLKSQAAVNCTEYLRHQGAFQVHRFETNAGLCFFSADPFNPPSNFVYRSYLMTDEGFFMVFNSYGPNNGQDGARVFYFFPRKLDPDMQARRGQLTLQTATPGLQILLSTDQAKILGMRGGKVKEASHVSPSNAGGVEFSEMRSLYLDSGFRMGQDPTGDPNGRSKFIDIKGRSCEVKNEEVFRYSSDGESEFRFSDNELKTFLSSRCPNLTVNF